MLQVTRYFRLVAVDLQFLRLPRTLLAESSKSLTCLRRGYACKLLEKDKITWSKWQSLRNLHRSCCLLSTADSDLRRVSLSESESSAGVPEWTKPLSLKEPELDMEYLLDPENVQEIRENIENRKGVGNISALVSVYFTKGNI